MAAPEPQYECDTGQEKGHVDSPFRCCCPIKPSPAGEACTASHHEDLTSSIVAHNVITQIEVPYLPRPAIMDGDSSFHLPKKLPEGLRKLVKNKQQLCRHILSFFAILHMTASGGKLYWHFFTGRVQCTRADFWSFILGFFARLWWNVLFKEPDRYLDFRRPTRAYKVAVCSTVITLTIPNLWLHWSVLKCAWEGARDVYAGFVNAVAAFALWILITAFVSWMAWSLLLRETDDAIFEPVSRTPVGEGISRRSRLFLAPAAHGSAYLATAFQEQSSSLSAQNSIQQSAPATTGSQDDQRNASSTDDVHVPCLRCPTIAHYEYKYEAHIGVQSWWADRGLCVIVATYATIIGSIQMLLIRQDRLLAKYKSPSPTITHSLYLPLGIYLLCVYFLRHRVRASLFEKFEPAVPDPWKRMIRVIPGVTMFRNLQTGDITERDPRRRAMPLSAYKRTSDIDDGTYIDAFNSGPQPCTSFFSHLGRVHRTMFRSRPTLIRITFLLSTTYLVGKGFWKSVWYDVLNPYEEILKHSDITAADIKSIRAQVNIWQILIYSAFPLTIFGLVVSSILLTVSIVVIWGSTVLKYANREQSQANTTEGQIRLD